MHILPSSPDIFAFNYGMQQGINVSHVFESPTEGEWMNGRTITQAEIQEIANHFTQIRLPVRWDTHVNAQNQIDPAYMQRIEEVVGWIVQEGMYCILDIHNYDTLYANVDEETQNFLSLWQQIAYTFRHYGEYLVLELLHEPRDPSTPQQPAADPLTSQKWNELIPLGLEVIRQHHRQRPVIIDGWGYAYYLNVNQLVLPWTDARLIVSVHHFEPINFTLQLGSNPPPTWGTQDDLNQMSQAWGVIDSAQQQLNRPFHIGEFLTKHGNSDMNSRALWAQTMCNHVRQRFFSFSYFDFYSHTENNTIPEFGIYNLNPPGWNMTLLNALK
jgi:endoglucanase